MICQETPPRSLRPLLLLLFVFLGIGAFLTLGVRGSSLQNSGWLSGELRPAQSGLRLQTSPAQGAMLPGLESVFAPDSALPVAPPPHSQPGQLLKMEKSSRSPLYQPGCTICMSGPNNINWNGGTSSFNYPQISNYRSAGTSGSLRVAYALSTNYPTFGNTIYFYEFSGYVQFNPLQAGYYYSAGNSGALACYQASIPAGTYWMGIGLIEYNAGAWTYTDFGVVTNQVYCNGYSGCTVIAAPTPTPTPYPTPYPTVAPTPTSTPSGGGGSCTPDSLTACLIGGRYRVTSHWRNQYAGGQTKNLAALRLTDATAAFWQADANTFEYLIRFNTATNNGRVWIAIPTFTDVEFWVAVTDTVNGQSKEYHSVPGNQSLIYDPFYFVYP